MIFNNFNSGYYHPMDRGDSSPNENIEEPISINSGDKPWNVKLGPNEVGTPANPFQHQLHALNAKIKEGASRIELGFFGTGKGQKERFTPESFDKTEREEMRNLARINKIRTTTHATVGVTGLAGFDPQRGFEEQNREQTMKEIQKAIDFAADASTGGAIVFHTGEWNRPIYDDFKNDKAAGETFEFRSFPGEKEKAPIMVADKRTGEIQALRKDAPIYEPVFKTVQDYEKETGKKLLGTKDRNGNTYEKGDWIGVNEEAVKRDWEFDTNKSKQMFLRVPIWNEKERNFKTERKTWDNFVDRAKEWNQTHDEILSPEEIFMKTQYMNQVLQSKGSALYYAQRYESDYQRLNEARKTLEYYKSLSDDLNEEEKKDLMIKQNFNSYVIPPKEVPIIEYLETEVKEAENHVRHIHEASAAADVQTKKAEEAMNNVSTVKDYGLNKSAETLAELGIRTWNKYEQNKDKMDEVLFMAPENWHPQQFGSHPDELLELVEKGRKKMADRLTPSMGADKAKELAERHIKTTIDIGHLNQWKTHLKRKTDENGIPIETDSQFDKRFSRWAMDKIEKLHNKNALGHIHLSDNFGYDDEHLNIGKGNAPVKEFVEFLAEKGYKDFIVEPGSNNPQTVLPEAWSMMGSPVYTMGGPSHPRTFSGVHQQHFGYDQPPFYVVGAYAPSNEWKLWSEVPFE
jgi:sugar phosphate isomerase/epimerase